MSDFTFPFFAETEQIEEAPLPTDHFLWLCRTAQTWTSVPVARAPRLAAFRFVCGKNCGMPFQPIIKVLPSTRYHSTSGTSSRNLTPSMKAFSIAFA
ncbi:MAG: hypothetical protein F3740_04535 [Nitrospinae bacterium]|nr:hypothetical protein [Nitrospinota bacterium]